MTNKKYNAVCCECQRLIKRGAYFNQMENDFVMLNHPSISVCGEIETWENWFNPVEHFVCQGTGTVPQFIEQ